MAEHVQVRVVAELDLARADALGQRDEARLDAIRAQRAQVDVRPVARRHQQHEARAALAHLARQRLEQRRGELARRRGRRRRRAGHAGHTQRGGARGALERRTAGGLAGALQQAHQRGQAREPRREQREERRTVRQLGLEPARAARERAVDARRLVARVEHPRRAERVPRHRHAHQLEGAARAQREGALAEGPAHPVQRDVVLEVVAAEHRHHERGPERAAPLAVPEQALVRAVAADARVDHLDRASETAAQPLLEHRTEGLVLLDLEAGDEGVAEHEHARLAGRGRGELRTAQAERVDLDRAVELDREGTRAAVAPARAGLERPAEPIVVLPEQLGLRVDVVERLVAREPEAEVRGAEREQQRGQRQQRPAEHQACASPTSAARAGVVRGTHQTKRAPPSGEASTPRRPPSRRATVRATGRPSPPEPPRSLRSRRTKRSKTRSRSASGMPGPASSSVIRTPSPTPSASSATRAPWLACRAALSSRFESTRSRSARSASTVPAFACNENRTPRSSKAGAQVSAACRSQASRSIGPSASGARPSSTSAIRSSASTMRPSSSMLAWTRSSAEASSFSPPSASATSATFRMRFKGVRSSCATSLLKLRSRSNEASMPPSTRFSVSAWRSTGSSVARVGSRAERFCASMRSSSSVPARSGAKARRVAKRATPKLAMLESSTSSASRRLTS